MSHALLLIPLSCIHSAMATTQVDAPRWNEASEKHLQKADNQKFYSSELYEGAKFLHFFHHFTHYYICKVPIPHSLLGFHYNPVPKYLQF